ncbi:hypothetical protein [Thermococcus barophilus]|uniref:Lipoprotein n=1 Tax=Thermococcus barophilus TaxID=55802 RepID=A0A0S1XE54_THEBA|nr:hypothetical protein [Thermococcus barophilus]ALM76077.1 conserved exported hypothetical protein [Thermococcus barophilus]
MRWLLIILLTILVLGCISQSYSVEDITLYWASVKSFEAQEIIEIGNQSFESHVIFMKPDKIIREDYVNGSLAQKIIIENNTQMVITSNTTFILNATITDVSALDPFAAILNDLQNFNVTKNDDILILKPKTPEAPTYEVKLDGKLPAKITIKQADQTITIEYKKLKVTG